jgi:hypothetical protein
MSLDPYYVRGSALLEDAYSDPLNRLGCSPSRPRSGVLGSGDGALRVRVDDDVGVGPVVPQEGSLYGGELSVESGLIVS